MKSVFTALLLLTATLMAAWLLALWGTAPLPVTLTLGTLTLQTSAPVAIMLLAAVLMLTFYLGRLTGWFLRLPGQLIHIRNRKAGHHVAEAYNAYFLGNPTEARKRLEALKPDTETHALLADLLQLRLHLEDATLPAKLEKSLANSLTTTLAAWAAARVAATQADWPEVARLTALGREQAPQLAALQVLQFKALVNLGDPQASALLPLLKAQLGTTHTKLVEAILHEPEAIALRPAAESRWIKEFELWLATPSETFPH